MGNGIDALVAGLKYKEKELQAIAHNISNANTQGYKEENIRFESLLKTEKQRSSKEMANYQPIISNYVDFSKGAQLQTSNPLDFALDGEGFFEIEGKQGLEYTRNGAFNLNSEGYLVTSQGERVMGKAGPIVVNKQGPVQVTPQGLLQVDGEVQGEIKIVGFGNLSALKSLGASKFQAAAEAQIKSIDSPSIIQGSIENSNVNLVHNLSRMVEVSRLFESYMKVVKLKERMNQDNANTLGRIG